MLDDTFAMIVAGNSTITDKDFVYRKLDFLLSKAITTYPKILLISGNSKVGVDSLVAQYAEEQCEKYKQSGPYFMLEPLPIELFRGQYKARAKWYQQWVMFDIVKDYPHRGCIIFDNGNIDEFAADIRTSCHNTNTALKVITVG